MFPQPQQQGGAILVVAEAENDQGGTTVAKAPESVVVLVRILPVFIVLASLPAIHYVIYRWWRAEVTEKLILRLVFWPLLQTVGTSILRQSMALGHMSDRAREVCGGIQ